MEERVFRSTSPEETRRLAARLGSRLRPGHFVLLEGELGAGKTVFVQGLAEGLGIADAVTSPTFALIHHYRAAGRRGDFALVHADLYRLKSEAEMEALGLEEASATAPLVVEWWRRAEGAFPPDRLEIAIVASDGDTRHFRCRATGDVHKKLLRAWWEAWMHDAAPADATSRRGDG